MELLILFMHCFPNFNLLSICAFFNSLSFLKTIILNYLSESRYISISLGLVIGNLLVSFGAIVFTWFFITHDSFPCVCSLEWSDSSGCHRSALAETFLQPLAQTGVLLCLLLTSLGSHPLCSAEKRGLPWGYCLSSRCLCSPGGCGGEVGTETGVLPGDPPSLVAAGPCWAPGSCWGRVARSSWTTFLAFQCSLSWSLRAWGSSASTPGSRILSAMSSSSVAVSCSSCEGSKVRNDLSCHSGCLLLRTDVQDEKGIA